MSEIELICKKYSLLKKELLHVLWEIIPELSPEIASAFPKITTEENYTLKEELGRGQTATF